MNAKRQLMSLLGEVLQKSIAQLQMHYAVCGSKNSVDPVH
jgi:hypothetical protein